MKKKGSELIFISRILRDGSGTTPVVHRDEVKHFDTEVFTINSLSGTNKTYIASGFNSYVVKFR